MTDRDLIIGELKEFKRATLKELSEIKKDVKGLKAWKWKVAGGSAVLSIITTFLADKFVVKAFEYLSK